MKAIITKYHGPTEYKGSRIIASDGDGNKVVVSYDPAFSSDANHELAACALCYKMNWHGKLCAGDLTNGCRVYVWWSEVVEV